MATRTNAASQQILKSFGLLLAPIMVLAGCGASTKTEAPIANIPTPIPSNVPLIEVAPPAPLLIGANRGEDLWHLRSGLNVAVLLCQGIDNQALVASYNKMLSTHKGLLSEAAQIEVNLYKAKGGKKWQDAYDDHMTKVYNSYSGTLTRDDFCGRSKTILTEAEGATPVAFNDRATTMLYELNRAAGLPDPDGALARRSLTSTQTVDARPAGTTATPR